MRTLFLLGTLLLMVVPVCAWATVNVFACEPEWAALAAEIGGGGVETFSATTARQDPHHVRAKPSLIAAMRKADLVICSGAGLEIGWLPVLLQKAGSAGVQPGAPGFLMAAGVVPMLEKPVKVDRSEGDIHPEGNPHVHLNPHNVARVAEALAERLASIDPAGARLYRERHGVFSIKWKKAVGRWEEEAAALRGAPVVTHHKSLTYLLDWLGMKEAGTLEPKPGIPATALHLEALLRGLKARPARAVLRTPYEPEDASRWLAEKTGVPAVTLPYTVGGDAESADLFALFGRTVHLLKEASRDRLENHGR